MGENSALKRRYEVLIAVNQATSDAVTDDALLRRVAAILVEPGGYPFVSVAALDKGLATRLSCAGETIPALDTNPVATDTEMVGWLTSPAQAWSDGNLSALAHKPLALALARAGFHSAAILPLVQPGQVVAALMVRSRERGAFDTEALDFLNHVASLVSSALSRLSQAQRFRALFEEASDAMLVIDGEQRVIDVNHATTKLLGYPQAELRELSMHALTPAEDPLRLPVGTRATVRQRSLRRKDGAFVPVEVSKRLVGDGLIQVIIRDLTERKRLESQLVIADRLVSLGTLASGVAHELNNPLSWIISNLSQASRLLGELPESEQRAELLELMGESLEGAHRIVSVVSDLKTFSRPDSPVARVSLHRVIDRSVQVLSIQARYRGKLVKQLGPVPDVIGTEAQLSQVFINLLLNAVQSLPEGLPELNDVTIASLTGPNGEAVVEVRDTGHGISPETLPRIFDPFFTTKLPGLGTGLGLSVIYNIVTSLGGRVDVQSTVGSGSNFRVVLPPAKSASVDPGDEDLST